jgi:hypothetical protein
MSGSRPSLRSFLPVVRACEAGDVNGGELMPTINARQIDAILPFLDQFEASGFSPGTWNSPSGQMPWFDHNEKVMAFLRVLYDHGWVTPSFDWTQWQDRAKEYVDSPDRIESADAETIQRLFTTHVRKERFCEGHLAALFESGHIVALLRRLPELRRTMGD